HCVALLAPAIHTRSLHDALPISYRFENKCCGGGCGINLSQVRAGLSLTEICFALALDGHRRGWARRTVLRHLAATQKAATKRSRSEEHTSELQSRENLVCRLLLE